jgi:chorismate mutase
MVGVATDARADDAGPLDNLVNAAAQRLQTGDPVAAFKWKTNTNIEDPPRVDQVIAAVTADAVANHIDPDYVTRVFGDQINATDAVEYTRFAQWKLDPAGAPATAPDLSSSRSTIDALNHTMVSEIALHWDVLHSPACLTELAGAKNAVTAARPLDGFYQQALSFAMRSYCQ